MKYEGIKEIHSEPYESDIVIRKKIIKKGSKILTLILFQVGIVLAFFVALLLVNVLGVDNKIFDVIKEGFAIT